METAKAFIVYPTYRIIEEKAFVYLFGRLENGESFLTINHTRPYFFIREKDHDKLSRIKTTIRYDTEKTQLKNFYSEPVIKVILDVPRDVPALRDMVKKEDILTYEADIRFVTRYLMDLGIKGSMNIKGDYKKGEFVNRIYEEPVLSSCHFVPKLKTLSLDIESSMDLKDIYCISLFADDFKSSLIVKDKKIKNAESFSTEKEMLLRFKELVHEYDPDIITGWNLIDFDFKFIKRKFDEYKIPFILGRADWPCQLKIQEDFLKDSSAEFPGRMVLDAMHLMRISFVSLSDFKLQTAAAEILGDSKLEIFDDLDKGEEIERIYKEKPEQLIEYNLKDCELVIKILKKKGIIDMTVQRSLLTGMQLDRVKASIASLDNLYIREANLNGYVCRTSDFEDREERIKGGYVRNSIPGIYDYIDVLDFKSLYPSIIRTFNIDPITFIPKEMHKKHRKEDVIEASNGAWFRKETGILPRIIEELWAQRDVAKKKKNSEQSYAIKITMNCFSSDTQILARGGIKNIKEIKKGDLVYTFNPENEQLDVMPVTKTYKYRYKGDLIKINSTHVDYLVTPNHRFLIFDGKRYVWKTAEELSKKLIRGWLPKFEKKEGKKTDKINLEKKCDDLSISYKVKNEKLQKGKKHSSIPKEYKIEDWLEFLGWYISEGHIYKCEPKRYEGKVSWRGESYRVTITQHKPDYKQEIINLFERMNLKYSVGKKTITITNQIIAEVLLKEIGQGSHIKKIPDWVFDLDHSLLNYIYASLMKGDGDKNGERYSTTSQSLAHDFLKLLFHLGIKGFIYQDMTRGFSIFRVQINKQRGNRPYLSKYRNFKSEKYDGYVYCVEVLPHHTIIAGRNNKLNVCGQSFFGVLANPMCRFYSLDMANAITHSGQFIVKRSADLAEELGYKVIYGDTDSIFVETKAEDIKHAEEVGNTVQRKINTFWQEYSHENFGMKSYMEIQFEKIFVRFMMPKIRGSEEGAKKRYAGLMIVDGKEKIDFTGLEFVRRDWTELSKVFQLELLDRIFHKKEVVDYIKKFVKELKAGKHDKLLIYKKAIRKDLSEYTKTTPPHVKAARKLGKITSSIIAYVMTTDGPEAVQKIEHPYDYEHYIDKQLIPIADSILGFYGTNFDDLMTSSKQTSLFGY